jgi:hypothetical protein
MLVAYFDPHDLTSPHLEQGISQVEEQLRICQVKFLVNFPPLGAINKLATVKPGLFPTEDGIARLRQTTRSLLHHQNLAGAVWDKICDP